MSNFTAIRIYFTQLLLSELRKYTYEDSNHFLCKKFFCINYTKWSLILKFKRENMRCLMCFSSFNNWVHFKIKIHFFQWNAESQTNIGVVFVWILDEKAFITMHHVQSIWSCVNIYIVLFCFVLIKIKYWKNNPSTARGNRKRTGILSN